MPYAFCLHGDGDGRIHAYGNEREFDQFWDANEDENVFVGSRKIGRAHV